MRGELFQFALRLTGNPFDAEDLVHDALLRAFASMSVHYGRVREPRPYLFRILTNLWIDQTRKAHPIVGLGEIPDTEDTGVVAADDALDIRDATDTLFVVLPEPVNDFETPTVSIY